MGLAEINNNLFRVDPINTLEVYSIKSITLSDFWGNSIEVSGSKLEKYISSRKDVEYEVHDDGLYITALYDLGLEIIRRLTIKSQVLK